MDLIKKINAQFNQHGFKEDIDNYGQKDYWATPNELKKNGGDCEDYAIAKYLALRDAGIPEDQLRVAYINDKKRGRHAVALYNNQVLDNDTDELKPLTSTPIYSFNHSNLWYRTTQNAPKNKQYHTVKTTPDKMMNWVDLLDRLNKMEGKQ